METSILNSTKKILGLSSDYTAFDLDIITHINTSFAVLHQLGIGPTNGFSIDDESDEWDTLAVPANQLSMVKSYIYLKTRVAFDPPTTSFLIEALNNQIKEIEYRLSYFREVTIPVYNGEVPAWPTPMF